MTQAGTLQNFTLPVRGLILSRHQSMQQGRLKLTYWLATEYGPVCAEVVGERLVMFVQKEQGAALKKLSTQINANIQLVDSTLSTLYHQNVQVVYSHSLKDYYALRQAAKAQGITLYEDDIRHADRFLMERFVKGTAWVSGEALKTPYGHLIKGAKMAKSDGWGGALKALSIDIECAAEGVLYSIGFYSEQVKKVIMVGAGALNPHDEVDFELIYVPDEIALLKAFVAEINTLNPDILIGWNVCDFDCKVLAERAAVLGVQLTIGRDGSELVIKDSAIMPVELKGRAVIDGISVLKNATYHFQSFALDDVSHALLGKQKLIAKKDKLAEINRQFQEDKVALAQYNLEDCKLVWDIFTQERLFDFIQTRAELTGLELERPGGSVAAFTHLYLPLLHRSGFVAPNLGDAPLNENSPGGYVMEATPGRFENVIVLDFKSLYPSIIRSFLIDPMGLALGLNEPDAVPGFKGGQFSRSQHHLPDLVAALWSARDKAKKQQDSVLSNAIKIIMNSLYGVLGSSGCRFFDPRLASSITMRGHEIMTRTKAFIEEQGHTVIYGDTDSTFVALESSLSHETCFEQGNALAIAINDYWCKTLKDEFDLTCYLEIEFETLYSPFFLPTIRGQAHGSKKRYAGNKITPTGNQLVFKGLESVRSDWTQLARQFQGDLFNAFFSHGNLTPVILDYVNRLEKGEFDALLTYEKRLRQPIEDYVKNIPPHARAVISAVHQGQILPPNKGMWVKYVITSHGPVLKEFAVDIDRQYYVEKQLKPIADMLLPSLNLTFNDVISGQSELF